MDERAPNEDWLQEGVLCASNLYGGGSSGPLANFRASLFSKKKIPPLKIKCLPPTDEAVIQHIKRPRLQVLIWVAAERTGPPLPRAGYHSVCLGH